MINTRLDETMLSILEEVQTFRNVRDFRIEI